MRDHALFIAFAPADKPRYAIGCIIEHGGFGASAAAPIVRDSMTYLFDQQKAWPRSPRSSSNGEARSRSATPASSPRFKAPPRAPSA